MTELSDSTALCNQLNFHESEDDNNNNNVNDIFIGNLSQNSTPEDTMMNNSLNIQNDIKDSNDEANDDDNDAHVEYNDTIDEYIKTTKKKTPQTNTKTKTKTNAMSIKKPKASSTSIKKNTAIIKHSSTSLKKNNNSITKPKSKSIKASHSTVTSASRSSNFTKNLTQSKTIFKNNNNNTSSKKLNVKVKATSSTAVKPKTSKNTINSNNNANKHQRTKSEITSINKESTITSHSNNTIITNKKEDVLPLNMSLHLPTTEQAQTNVVDENNGLTQLIFSKDESNDVSTVSAQRVPARKRTRRDSYKHSIMVVQEKLLKKEEEKGESNKISFNDNEHQIRRKRSALGDFKDIDENATKPPPKLRKSSRKFTALRSSKKVVNKQNQNEDINTNNNNNNINDINDNTTNNANNDDRRGNFEFEHSPIIEEKHDYGSTERKMKHNEMNDKFMKLFNEIKNKIQTEKEKTKQQKLKLKKSSSIPLINTKNKSLIYTTKTNDNITTKRQLLSDLLKHNTRNNNSNTDRNTNNNNNNDNLKRSAELKTKFKLLKRNDINNNTNIHNHHNKVNSFTNSALLLQLKHEYNKKYLLDNGVVSLSAENENEKEGEGAYKTFEELKSKTLRNGLDLNKLSINKSLGIFEVHNGNKNKSSKVRNAHYKGLSLSQLLLSSFMHENGNCDLNAKVCPPNAMEKSKFNYFVE